MTTRAVLLTRFNLPTTGREGVIRAQEGWLRDRVELFERYTVPSVRRQSLRPDWLVYLDPESPGWLLGVMAVHSEEGLLRPVFRRVVLRDDLHVDLGRLGIRSGDRLVTANLDNDDGLADDFVARVVAVDPGGATPTAIYVCTGLVLRDTEAYRLVDRRNAFCAVAEPADTPVTCWADWHTLLPETMPVVEVRGAPGWLQVVHGRNVSNRVRGRRVDPGALSARFGELLAGVTPVSRAELARERWVRLPARAGREAARRTVKVALMRALGKRRFDDLKSAVSLWIDALGARGQRRIR